MNYDARQFIYGERHFVRCADGAPAERGAGGFVRYLDPAEGTGRVRLLALRVLERESPSRGHLPAMQVYLRRQEFLRQLLEDAERAKPKDPK